MTVQLGVTLYHVAFWIYLAATVGYVGYLVNRQNSLGQAATSLLVAGWAVHTVSLVVRTVAAQRPPFLNLYEYMLSLTWGVVLVYLVLQFKTKSRELGAFVVPLVTFFTYLAATLDSEVNPTMPALRSGWQVPHIGTAILAYSSFALAFGLAIMYVIRERSENQQTSFWNTRLPSLKVLDQVTYRVIAFGFMMQTALLITGAIWAQYAWGRFWGWDPKETWALITWLIYAAYLHTRMTMGWRGHKSALIAIIGFLATIFTLVGSLWLSGLHSYAR
jgi:cytochrome c-type biogenesis protein CcsB